MLTSARDDLRQRILRPGRILRAVPDTVRGDDLAAAGEAGAGAHETDLKILARP